MSASNWDYCPRCRYRSEKAVQEKLRLKMAPEGQGFLKLTPMLLGFIELTLENRAMLSRLEMN